MASRIDPEIHRRAKRRNLVQTWLIIAGLTGVLTLSAWLLFGWAGVLWTLGLAVFVLAAAPSYSPAMVLRLYKARNMSAQDVPQLWQVLSELARRAELKTVPHLYYIPSANMNAFAVGTPDNAAITVTDGLLRGLNLRQLTGVLAHEISHIANGDIRVMAIADIVNRLTGALQTVGLFLLLIGLWQSSRAVIAAIVLLIAPTIGALLQLALSRAREYDADLEAVQLTGDAEGLASALATLERRQGNLWENFILPGARIPDPSLLRTHPRTAERVERLLTLRRPELQQIGISEAPSSLPGHYPVIKGRPRFRSLGLWY